MGQRETEEQFRAAEARIRAAEAARHAACLHSAVRGATHIVWHLYDDKQLRGICALCGRRFLPGQPDYAYWLQRPTINLLSTAAFPTRVTPEEAALLDAPPPPVRQHPLDDLSDEEINALYEGVREKIRERRRLGNS